MAIGRTFRESLPEGPARAGSRPVRPRLRQEGPLGHRRASRPIDEIKAKLATPNAERVWYDPLRLAGRAVDRADPRAHGHRPLVPATTSPSWSSSKGGSARSRSLEEAGDDLIREAKRNGFSDRQLAHLWDTDRGRGPPRPPAPGDRRRLQAGRHLRRRVRGGHALLLFDLRGRGRGAGRRQAPRRDPGRRPEPDRPGDRVRLLLLPGRLRPQGRRLRGGDGQLQPRDRQHRLRHVGPPLLRAADGRGRAQRLRAGPARWA